jgi:hypothetical protein
MNHITSLSGIPTNLKRLPWGLALPRLRRTRRLGYAIVAKGRPAWIDHWLKFPSLN